MRCPRTSGAVAAAGWCCSGEVLWGFLGFASRPAQVKESDARSCALILGTFFFCGNPLRRDSGNPSPQRWWRHPNCCAPALQPEWGFERGSGGRVFFFATRVSIDFSVGISLGKVRRLLDSCRRVNVEV